MNRIKCISIISVLLLVCCFYLTSLTTLPAQADVYVEIGSGQGANGEIVTVPVTFTNVPTVEPFVHSIELFLTYDPNVVKVEDISVEDDVDPDSNPIRVVRTYCASLGELTGAATPDDFDDDWFIEQKAFLTEAEEAKLPDEQDLSQERGYLRIALATNPLVDSNDPPNVDSNPLAGDGEVLFLSFKVVGQPGELSPLTVEHILLNEDDVGQPEPQPVPVGTVTDGEIEIPDNVCLIPWTVTPTPTFCDFHGVAEIDDGVPAEPGDVIGAFVSDVVINDGCVGIFELVEVPGFPGIYGKIHVYGDDTFTPEKDGATAGDTIIFKILDRSECEVYDASVVSGDPTWTGGATKEVDLRAITMISFELRLVEGWNLVSWPVATCFYQGSEPTEPLPAGTQNIDISTLGYSSMQDWFTDLVIPNNNIGGPPWRAVTSALRGGAAKSMDSTLLSFLNDLDFMAPGYGYWVKMEDGTNGGTITIDGQFLPPDAILSLAEGWDLVGYLPTVGYYDISTPPDDSLMYATPNGWIQKPSPVYDYSLASINGKWRACITAKPGGAAMSADSTLLPFLNDLNYFAPGYGYWIKATEAVDLSWASDSGGNALVAMSPGRRDIFSKDISIKPTNRSMFIYGTVSLDGKPAPVESNITIWNSNGALVGKGTVKRPGVFGLFPIYGDDLTTDKVDGAIVSEELIVKVNGNPASPTIRWLGDREFQKIDLASRIRIIPSVSWLGQNYPNPFNPETWFPYALSESAKVTVQIYDLSGSIVRTINLGEKSPGVYDIRKLAAYWNGRNDAGERVSSGLYFYKLTAADFAQVKRMVILK